MELVRGAGTSSGTVRFEPTEVVMLQEAMATVTDGRHISEHAFSVRLGPSLEVGRQMCDVAQGWDAENGEVVDVDRDLLDVLASALNEVVNGIRRTDAAPTVQQGEAVAALHTGLRRASAQLTA